LALTWVREKELPTVVLERLWAQVKASKIACKMVLLDRYFFSVSVMTWLKDHDLPFLIPAVMRGRKPKPGTKAKGLRSCRTWKAGTHDYTHQGKSESVDIRLVITYKSYRHRCTKKRCSRKLFFATWKVRLSPTQVRETYRRRFGIETSYRQLNQSRSRTTSRDPLYRLLLVGLSLFLRNVWQWMVRMTTTPPRGAVRPTVPAKPTRYRDVLDEFGNYLWKSTQTPNPTPAAT
jgi:hypothetical protein